MFVSDMQPQPQRTLQFRREHHFEYTLEQNGFPAYLRPVCIEMYNKCTAVCKTLGRTNSLHIAYLIARFRQLLLEDLVIPDKGVGQYMGVRSLPVRIEHHVLWRKICYVNGWKCFPPYSAAEDYAARVIQRRWRRRKRSRADAVFKATLTLFCDATPFPISIREEIQRCYFISQDEQYH